MITLNENTKLQFSNMGLFDFHGEWIHPTVTIDSFEIIYVMAGEIFIREDDKHYLLKPGETLLLSPHHEHGGTKVSFGHTAFYWLHFYCDQIDFFSVPKQFLPDKTLTERKMKEILHLQKENPTLAELFLAEFLLTAFTVPEFHNKLAYETSEYIRINSNRNITVTELARYFGYNGDYLSRIYKSEFGTDLKTGITNQRISYIKSVLLNTDCPINEIADACGFQDDNSFVKFFKYHEGITPTKYRKKFFHTHMNNK